VGARLNGRIPWDRVSKTESCWLWTGAVDSRGYGKLALTTAHRWFYMRLTGPILEGLQLDHTCRVPACVNPDHLEPVTQAENIRRRAAALTHCKAGHEYAAGNERIRPGGARACRACDRATARRFRDRRRAVAA
jgi:hypothetical protein